MVLVFSAALLMLAVEPREVVLFEPTAATNQLSFIDLPAGKASVSRDDAGLHVDTSNNRSVLAGLTVTPLAPLPSLDRDAGVELSFEVRLEREEHTSADDDGDGLSDRAGLSIILLDQQRRGVELGFWPTRVWAQDDGARLFLQAEGARLDATTRLVHCALRLSAARYTLVCEGSLVLEGRVRDYSRFRGSPNPYRTPNYVFIGDDSTRSSAAFTLGRVAVVHQARASAPDAAPTTGKAPRAGP